MMLSRLLATISAIVLLAAANVATPQFIFEPQLHTSLANVAAGGSTWPNLFFTPSGHLYVLAALNNDRKTDLAVFISDNLGVSFSKRVAVPTVGDVMAHGEMSPVLANDPTGALMYVLWQSGSQLYVAHGSEFARTLSQPVPLIDKQEQPDGHTMSSNGFATMNVAPDGTVLVAWLDGRDADNKRGTTSVYVTASTDHGKTFGPERRIGSNACPCCRPSIAFDGDGHAYVAWRDVFPENERDFVVARGEVKTLAFERPARISADGWQINGCPDSGASIAWIDGRLWAAWFTLGKQGIPQVRVASSNGKGPFTKPVVISQGIDSANHPRFVFGARRPMLVFEGEPRTKGVFSEDEVFLATIEQNGRPTVQPIAKLRSEGFDGYAAGMPNAQTLVVAASMAYRGKPQIILQRGRSR